MSVPRVLVVWCPDWPLVAVGAEPEAPAAVVTSGRVAACTAVARAAGVRRGQRLRDAQRYSPELIVHHDDPDGEARAFEPVVAAIEEICPRVEVVRPGLAAISVRGPARYYGGEAEVAVLVRDAILGRDVACAVGIGDGTFAADLAARAAWEEGAGGGDGVRIVASADTGAFLAPQPVSVLELPDLAGVLVRLGVRQLGDLAALPVRDVLARFGGDGVVAHRLARGLEARPPATRAPGSDLAAELEFDPPIAQSEPAVFAAKRLADQLHAGLAERGLVCVQVEVEAGTDDGRSRARLWRHDGLLSSLAVAERVRWQLDAWRTAGELGGSLTYLRLAPEQLVVDSGRQLALWGQSRVSDEVTRAATRIQVMLGHAAVTTVVPVGGREPGERVRRVPWGDSGDSSTPLWPAEHPWPGRVPDPAPAVTPAQPRPAVVRDSEGHPVWVDLRSTVSAAPVRLDVAGESSRAITEWTGPWPVWERWWRAGEGRRCARFQLVTDDGCGWLVAVTDDQWVVEAVYA